MIRKDTSRMSISLDLQDRITKLDQQIADLLEELVGLYVEASEEDEAALSPEARLETVAEWEAIAEEKGWPVPPVHKIASGIFELGKSMAE